MTTPSRLRAMRDELAAVDPAEASARQAEDLLADAVAVANAALALAGRAAQRVGATNGFRRFGDRSAAHHLGRVAGVGLGTAKTMLSVTDAAAKLPATDAAVRHGELSMRQAAAITSAATADPGAEARLLQMAKTHGVVHLEEECARVRAAADPADAKERNDRARRERGTWKHVRPDGSAEVRFRSTVDDVAEVWSIISAFRDHLFRDAPQLPEGQRPTFDQQSADAFLEMCRTAASGTLTPTTEAPLPFEGLPFEDSAPARMPVTPKKVVVRIDLAALLRGYPCEGEVCDIPGYGPVPASAVRDMLATGNPFLAAVVTKGVDVATVAHLGRDPTAHQRTALEWLDPRCRAEGCDRTMGLEIDHRIDWAPTEVTLLGWLEWLCRHHHQLKTTKKWRLVRGKGVRPFVPPDDPRHPDNCPPPPPDS